MHRPKLVAAVFIVALILLWVYADRTGMENRGFVVAGYGLTWGALLGYARRLSKRAGETERALDLYGAEDSGDDGEPSGAETH